MGFLDRVFSKSGTDISKPKMDNRKIIAQIRVLMDRSQIIDHREESKKLINLVISLGDEGIQTFNQCYSDCFSMRAHPFSLWGPAIEIAKKTKNESLFEQIEHVVKEGGDLVYGNPKPPSWMPSLETDIIGGGKFGWSSDSWMAHEGAEFIRDNISLLPPDRQLIHLKNLKDICLYRAGIWIEVKNRGRSINPGAVEEEIQYWTGLHDSLR